MCLNHYVDYFMIATHPKVWYLSCKKATYQQFHKKATYQQYKYLFTEKPSIVFYPHIVKVLPFSYS